MKHFSLVRRLTWGLALVLAPTAWAHESLRVHTTSRLDLSENSTTYPRTRSTLNGLVNVTYEFDLVGGQRGSVTGVRAEVETDDPYHGLSQTIVVCRWRASFPAGEVQITVTDEGTGQRLGGVRRGVTLSAYRDTPFDAQSCGEPDDAPSFQEYTVSGARENVVVPLDSHAAGHDLTVSAYALTLSGTLRSDGQTPVDHEFRVTDLRLYSGYDQGRSSVVWYVAPRGQGAHEWARIAGGGAHRTISVIR